MRNTVTIFLKKNSIILYEGDCSYGPDESMGREVGAKFRRAQHLHRTGRDLYIEKIRNFSKTNIQNGETLPKLRWHLF